MKLLQEVIYFLTIRPRLNRLKKLLPEASIYPAGSRYVCNPPVLGTDIDFLVYSEEAITFKLLWAKFKKSEFREYFGQESHFTAWRRGRINLIVTSSTKYRDDFNLATQICKDKNVRWKYHRVVVHERLRGTPEDELAYPAEMDASLKALVENLTGPHGATMRQIYKAQHNLV